MRDTPDTMTGPNRRRGRDTWRDLETAVTRTDQGGDRGRRLERQHPKPFRAALIITIITIITMAAT
jgi:hypothetical protein